MFSSKSLVQFFCLGCFAIVLFSCKKKEDPAETASYNRTPLLEHYAKDVIRPAYSDLQMSTNALKTAVDALVANVGNTNLLAAQNAWVNAYSDFQYVNAYNFGPAGEAGVNKTLTDEIGVFPTSTSKIENFISLNDNSNNNFDRDSRGFLAIEYLLFDLGGVNANITSALADANRKNYLVAITNHSKAKIDAVVNAWISYEKDFIANSGSDAGSSISYLFNAYLQGYELLKNYKVGFAAGLNAGQVVSQPTKVAGYYSGKSLDFIKLHYQAVEQVWYGKNKAGIDGIGFEEYLQQVEGGQNLVDQTKAQFASVQTAMNAVPTNVSLPTTIQTNKATVDELHLQLSKLTHYIKADMSSLLGIYITYASGDTD